MIKDTVFSVEMNPVFADEPVEVLRRLKAKHPESWSRVCIGSTGTIVTIPEYLYQDKYLTVQKMIKDVLKKSDLSMYKRSPERLEKFIEQTAVRVIELVLKDS